MKRKNIIIASLLMSGILTTEAQVVKVNDTEALANDEMEIVVTANADINNYVAAGFNIELPEGFSVVGVEGVKGDAIQSNHVVRVGQANGSKIRVAVYSMSNLTFGIEDGNTTLCTLKLKAPDKEGSFSGLMNGVEYATASNVLTKGTGVQFGITIKPGNIGKLGDADGNGKVEAADIDAVVRYIMEGDFVGFNFDNANLNDDDKVDAADLVLLIKMLQP